MRKSEIMTRTAVDADALVAITGQFAGTEKLKSPAADAAEIENLMKGVEELRRLPIKDIVPPLTFRPVGDAK